jgi:TPR repeat protein/DnaJ-domain-containing protein 1
MKIHTYYDNLKVVRTAPIAVIKASYRALSQQYHPDKNNGSLESTHIMKIINQAYAVLSDPIQRAAYDEELRQKEAKIQQASSAQTKPSQSEPPAQEKSVKSPKTPQSSQKGTGWVYILSNKTFPNLVKIGMTTKTPEERAKGLDNTGLPYRYVVEYKIRVNNHHKLEQAVHRDMKYCRENKGKEFFRCTVEDAIKSINKIINNDTFNQYVTPKKPVSQAEEAEQWFKLGLAAYSKQDYQTAFNYYQKAATQNNVDAQSNLGYMYQYGQGVIKDEATAVKWYQKAAQQGNVYSQNKLSSIYEKNIKAQKEAELQKAAEQGDAEAQYNLGVMYQDGLGVVKNECTAVKWYTKAAEQGHAKAQYNLGVMHEKGQGVIKNEQTAVEWYTKAAEQGHAKAQYNLGVMYANGQGVIKNERSAVEWYTKAAEQGLAEAQYNLGLMYANGQSVVKNERTAVEWYTKAAEQGHAKAQYNLGVMHEKGQGVIKNEQTAVEWYTKAAEQGHAKAQYNLGVMYYNGQGVIKNMKTAYFWWLIASANSNENAKTNIEIAEKGLTPAQKQAVQDAAANWLSKKMRGE